MTPATVSTIAELLRDLMCGAAFTMIIDNKLDLGAHTTFTHVMLDPSRGREAVEVRHSDDGTTAAIQFHYDLGELRGVEPDARPLDAFITTSRRADLRSEDYEARVDTRPVFTIFAGIAVAQDQDLALSTMTTVIVRH
jgi:hypothetical protein